jgi:hypothetical protein
MAAWVEPYLPPSLKLSGVTLRIPITNGTRPNASVTVRSFQDNGDLGVCKMEPKSEREWDTNLGRESPCIVDKPSNLG